MFFWLVVHFLTSIPHFDAWFLGRTESTMFRVSSRVWTISGGCNDFFGRIDFLSMLVFHHRHKSCFGRTVIIVLFINRLKQN